MKTECWSCFAWSRKWMALLDPGQVSNSPPWREIVRETIDYVCNIRQLIRSCALIQ